ncbi:MAG: VWA domain-containing protein [Thermoanaerobaculia bacterium]|nr:MAG: VWA domain-containing protein [Thermoanaerobaculia bacterium]
MSPGAKSLVAALLAGVGAAVAAAQTPAAQAPVFGEIVEVRVVNLEVVVTDRDGLPVTGLAAGDFRLLVDGEEVPVAYFTEVRGGQAIEGGGAATEGAVAGVPDLVPGTPVGTSYLVFIDDYFSIARDRNRVLAALAQDLSRLGPEDRMAIVAWDGSGLEMLSTWSGSSNELERALQKAQRRRAHGLARESERKTFLGGLTRRGQPGTFARGRPLDNRLEIDELRYAEMLENQLRNVSSAAAAALRGFANPPGRKVMLLLSGGWPYDIPEFVTQQSGRVIVESQVEHGSKLFAPVVETSNRLGYTVYAVDVPGLGNEAGIDASEAEAPAPGDGFGPFVRESNLQYTLQHVAAQTGGRALLNATRTTVLASAAADTRTYYWLGFVPAWQGDDRARKIDVEVRRADLRVRSRASYLDSSRGREVSMAVESALMFGGASNMRPLALSVSRPVRASIGTMRVGIELNVPAGELTLLPVGQQQVAQLELRVAAIDEHGGRSEVTVLPVRLVLDAVPPPGQLVGYRTLLELRKARNRIAVALYDPAAGTIWSKTVEIEP